MFGITDTPAEDSTRGEQELLGNMSEVSSRREKRPAPHGHIQSSTKYPKIEHQFFIFRKDNHDDGASTSSRTNSSNDITFKQTEFERETCDSDSWKTMETSLSKSSSSTDIKKYQTECKLDDVKLKELRVILNDIKYDRKNGIETLLAEPNLWEVESILGKKVFHGKPNYLIKWKNWSPNYNTWEPESNLVNCLDILNEFENRRLLLLNRFKRKTNFYPNDKNMEKYLNHLKSKGETLDSILVESKELYNSIQNFLRRRRSQTKKKQTIVKQNVLRMLIVDSRIQQLKSLEEWEVEMNNITKGRPMIQVENIVDFERAPENFYYIDDYLPGEGVIIPDDPPIGCECNTCNFKTKCCFSQDNRLCPYTATYKIRVPPGTPIYECNKRCTCDMNCINRVVQRGTEMKFCIFRTENGRGWGVKTLQLIRKGSFVTEYVGEVITSEEAEKRGKVYDTVGRTYLFDLDYNETEEQCPYTVDAAMYGNVSHFINHSCDPNLAVYGVWINCLDPNLPKLALFATRDIKRDEEITFDYTCQSPRHNENSIKQDLSTFNVELEQDLGLLGTPESDQSSNKVLCKCGAKSCRRYLF